MTVNHDIIGLITFVKDLLHIPGNKKKQSKITFDKCIYITKFSEIYIQRHDISFIILENVYRSGEQVNFILADVHLFSSNLRAKIKRFKPCDVNACKMVMWGFSFLTLQFHA